MNLFHQGRSVGGALEGFIERLLPRDAFMGMVMLGGGDEDTKKKIKTCRPFQEHLKIKEMHLLVERHIGISDSSSGGGTWTSI